MPNTLLRVKLSELPKLVSTCDTDARRFKPQKTCHVRERLHSALLLRLQVPEASTAAPTHDRPRQVVAAVCGLTVPAARLHVHGRV